MKEIISDKIDNMDELEDRTILKGIVRDVFEGLVDYQKEFNNKLEDRIFNEINDKESSYDIYTTIVSRDDLQIVSDFLFPLLEEDYNKRTSEEILNDIFNKDKACIEKVFLKESYEELKNLYGDKDRTFTGEILTDTGSYEIEIILEFNDNYIKAEQKLYDIFLENTINWRTINNPYSRKMFDIIVVGYEQELEEINDFEKIEYHLEEFDEVVFKDYIPVWNIREVFQKGEGFPVPAQNTTNYDHYISVENLDLQNGYLVVPDGFNLISVKKKEEDIIITSDESNSNPWKLIEIVQNEREKERDYDFTLLSNSKKSAFINKLGNNNINRIRTKADLERIIHSYRDISGIKLEEIVIVDKEIEGGTYDYNVFIEDEIRQTNFKHTLLLKFSTEFSDFLEYDIISFIVSEIQLLFPGYLCRGVSVE